MHPRGSGHTFSPTQQPGAAVSSNATASMLDAILNEVRSMRASVEGRLDNMSMRLDVLERIVMMTSKS